MKLYIYEHCPFCSRARLALGLKEIAYETVVVMEGDDETPTRLIGKKMVPILEKLDGSHMGESLDIVQHVDAIGTPIFDGPADPELDGWAESVAPLVSNLASPRMAKGNFAEMATEEARAFFVERMEKKRGSLAQLLEETSVYAAEMNPRLVELASLLEKRSSIGISDIKLWPVLNSLSMVKALEFPPRVRSYMEDLSERGKVPLLFDQAI